MQWTWWKHAVVISYLSIREKKISTINVCNREKVFSSNKRKRRKSHNSGVILYIITLDYIKNCLGHLKIWNSLSFRLLSKRHYTARQEEEEINWNKEEEREVSSNKLNQYVFFHLSYFGGETIKHKYYFTFVSFASHSTWIRFRLKKTSLNWMILIYIRTWYEKSRVVCIERQI